MRLLLRLALMAVSYTHLDVYKRQVGNYGESFERNVGEGSPLKIKRGLNAQWTQGGLMYALPIR